MISHHCKGHQEIFTCDLLVLLCRFIPLQELTRNEQYAIMKSMTSGSNLTKAIQ